MSTYNRPLVLTILDGWGYRAETANNAIALARKPTYDKLLKEFPNTLIQASDHFVGLPDGQMGNSEVGHMNLGAGRVVQMDITRIDMQIASGEFQKNPAILKAMQRALDGGRQLQPLLHLPAKGLREVILHADVADVNLGGLLALNFPPLPVSEIKLKV